MKEIDAVIDSAPTEQLVLELAQTKVRNLDCFRELQSLNDNGKFLFKHPIIRMFSLRAELEKMLRNNPPQFLKEYALTHDNVKRYTSYLKCDKYTPQQREKHQEQYNKHREREELMKDVLESANK